MKIIINAQDLRRHLNDVMAAITPRPFRAEWAGVHIEAESTGTVRFSARNEMFEIIRCTSDCQVEDPGTALIPAKLLLEYVSTMSGEVTVTADAKNANLRCQSKHVSIVLLDKEEYEVLSVVKADTSSTMSLSGKAFSDIITRISYCASQDEGRKALTGVYLNRLEDSTVDVVALDGFRVSLIKLNAGEGAPVSLLIPAYIAKIAAKLFSNSSDITLTSVNEGSGVSISDSQTDLNSALLTGSYPEYQKVIPRSHTTHIRLHAQDLLSAVRMAMISAGVTRSTVSMSIAESMLSISARDETSDSMSNLDVDYDGQPLDIMFNGKYIIDALSNMPSGTDLVDMYFGTNVSPVLIVPTSFESSIALVLPVRQLR